MTARSIISCCRPRAGVQSVTPSRPRSSPRSGRALKKWRAEVTKKPSASQLDRLRALARRVERLWQLALRRLEISEREVSRHIDVWGADIDPVTRAVTREQIESELIDPD